MIWIILQNALSALTVIVAKKAFNYAAPLFYIGSRMVLAGFILLSYQFIFKRQVLIHKNDFFLLGQVIIIQLYMACLLDTYALHYLSSAQVCLLYNLSPFVAGFFSYYFFKETLSIKKIIGICFGFLGFLPMLLTKASSHDSVGFISWAGFALLIAVIGNTYGYIILRILIRDRNYSSVTVVSVALLCGGLLVLLTSSFFEGSPYFAIDEGLPFFRTLIISTFTAHIIAYNLYSFLLKRYSVTFLSFASILYPLFGALFGWIFFHETITWNFLLTLIIVTIGLFIFYREEFK